MMQMGVFVVCERTCIEVVCRKHFLKGEHSNKSYYNSLTFTSGIGGT